MSDLLLRFGMKLQQSCQNFTICARGTYWEKTFVLKKISYRTFSGMRAKSFRPDFEQKLPTFPEEIFHGKNISFKKSCLFSVYAKVLVRIIGRNILASCSKLLFGCPEERVSWKKLLPKKNHFFPQLDLEQNFFDMIVLRQLSDSLEKIAI